MKKNILLFSLLMTLNLNAEDKKENLNLKSLGTIDQKIVAPKEQDVKKNSKSSLVLTCKNNVGTVFEKGTGGYDTCMGEVGNQIKPNQFNKNKNEKNGLGQGNSAGFSIKVGE